MGTEFDSYWNRVGKAAGYLKDRLDGSPEIGIMTGTGLAGAADLMDVDFETGYEDIPQFPVSTVQSHTGRLFYGEIFDRPVLVMKGRFHLYEGYCPHMVAFPVRVMQALGVHTLIVTNAAGGLNPDFAPGDIMAVSDHINLTGENPLVGPNNEEWGIRFPDMSSVYSPELIGLAADTARKYGISMEKGIYAGLKGPSLETPAETRFIRQIGADAVGLSTVQEVIAAVHAEMRIVGFSIITNVNDPDRPESATVEQIIGVAEKTAPVLGRIITELIKEL
ncbi:MAG: purine-nucleoside phosphorylase [Desulfobacteraceae bacterium]|nr:purine-nucleoside phosphorylase [Desulfobacteraceae bacterium]